MRGGRLPTSPQRIRKAGRFILIYLCNMFDKKLVQLTKDEEESLEKAMKTKSIMVDSTKKGELEIFLDKAKKTYI